METFKKVGWASSSALTIELDNKILINWLENSLQRPWSIAKYIAEIDSLVRGCIAVQFKLADISNLAMASNLALDGLSRTNCSMGVFFLLSVLFALFVLLSFVFGWFPRDVFSV
ncbi:hypothetical protein V6N11_073206 [Hibiscus sabdariffa]|uniref:RNase H type-1 domain-containing protein n=1 Tax=Hibiscus sabdariffa TaxID=183260 RepID=A0ABR2A5M2_9ROSI